MAEKERSQSHAGSLLAPSHYDDDADSIHSVSDQDSDPNDDEVLQGARDSREIARYDRTVLEEEEERDKLLLGGSARAGLRRIFSGGHGNSSSVKIGKREQRKQKRKEKRATMRERKRAKKDKLMAGNGENGELMFEMEEGGLRSDESSESSGASSDIDRRKFDSVFSKKLVTVHVVIIAFFCILFFAAFRVSRNFRTPSAIKLLSNGTSSFAPTTILISLDGFRADFLDRGLTPTLNSFIAEGISPKYMLPSFPSVTFPNHFTLVTGLYPESHGIVGNTFWDPGLQEEFYYTDPARSMQSKWWQGEPLWVTAENQGIRSAIHMWPGSEANIGDVTPAFLDKYNGTEVLARKVDRVLELLDKPGPGISAASIEISRPQFIAAYVPVVDADGHLYGPNSTEIRDTIKSVDDMLHQLFIGLIDRNLTDIVNVVIVSDHGMASTSTERLIQLEDLIDTSLIEHIDGWPLYGLRPKNSKDLDPLYTRLKYSAAADPNFEVYLRNENMPERYHFTKNDRIAPLWIVPKTGWAIVTKDEFDVEKGKAAGEIYHPRGLHGYDHEHPLMRAIFVARGPAFPHKPNSRVGVFQNTEVYNIVCDSLNILPKPNNGTLRLPLKPVGLHSDANAPLVQVPEDPPSQPNVDTVAEVPPPPSYSAAFNESIAIDLSDAELVRPVIDDDSGTDKEESEKDKEIDAWWAYAIAKINAAKQWADDFFSHAGNGSLSSDKNTADASVESSAT
ncbi:MAG: ectonucleotide pyrophosphatase phosphodiesterase [Pycnora praestabilis]|nr:MAG: ectonucleotide pyrophosphatase phosphodiesterase [Pycnora praestabilis]